MAAVLDVASALGRAGPAGTSALDVSSLQHDSNNLLVSYSVPISSSLDGEALRSRCTLLTQYLVKQLFELPVEKSDVGPLAIISAPEPSRLAEGTRPFGVPREKPVRPCC